MRIFWRIWGVSLPLSIKLNARIMTGITALRIANGPPGKSKLITGVVQNSL